MGSCISYTRGQKASTENELDKSSHPKARNRNFIFTNIEKKSIEVDWKDTVTFTVPLDSGYVIKVYDGDTITVANRLPLKNDETIYRFSVRLNGIDTPEIKGKTDDEKEAARAARDAVAEKILHKHITLKNVSTEKYGRLLADVWIDDLHINNWLVDNRYALKYDGGTKTNPQSWIKYRDTGKLD